MDNSYSSDHFIFPEKVVLSSTLLQKSWMDVGYKVNSWYEGCQCKAVFQRFWKHPFYLARTYKTQMWRYLLPLDFFTEGHLKEILQDTDLQLLVKMTSEVLMLLHKSLNACPLFLLTSSQFNDLVYITWQVIDRSNTRQAMLLEP